MKKMVCLLLCLMLLVPAAVSMAAEIPSVSLTLTIPQAGTTAKDPPKVTVSSSAPVYLVEAFWAKPNGSSSYDDIPSTTVFEAGKVYYVGVMIHDDNNQDSFPDDISKYSSNVQIADFWPDYNHCDIVLKFTVPAAPAPAGDTENVSLSKLKSVKLTAVSAKKLKITWKKLSSKDKKKIKKIQIQVSTDKNFTTIVKEKLLKNTKTSWTIPGLKKNTKYFVRIRAYTKDGNTIYVSKWVIKNKKTKKK